MVTALYPKTTKNNGFSGMGEYDLSTSTAGSNVNMERTTSAGGVELQFPYGGTAATFYSPTIQTGITISGSIGVWMYGYESNAKANVAGHVKIYRESGGVLTLIGSATDDVEFPTAAAYVSFTVTPTSTVFAAGDRIVAKFAADHIGTMAAGYVAYCSIGGSNTVLEFTESITFGTPLVVRNGAAVLAGAGAVTAAATVVGFGAHLAGASTLSATATVPVVDRGWHLGRAKTLSGPYTYYEFLPSTGTFVDFISTPSESTVYNNAVSSSTAAYFTPTTVATAHKVTYATATNEPNKVSLSIGRNFPCGLQRQQYGYLLGGLNVSYLTSIERIAFATETASVLSATCGSRSKYGAGGNDTKGYYGGGSSYYYIDAFTYATETTASPLYVGAYSKEYFIGGPTRVYLLGGGATNQCINYSTETLSTNYSYIPTTSTAATKAAAYGFNSGVSQQLYDLSFATETVSVVAFSVPSGYDNNATIATASYASKADADQALLPSVASTVVGLERIIPVAGKVHCSHDSYAQGYVYDVGTNTWAYVNGAYYRPGIGEKNYAVPSGRYGYLLGTDSAGGVYRIDFYTGAFTALSGRGNPVTTTDTVSVYSERFAWSSNGHKFTLATETSAYFGASSDILVGTPVSSKTDGYSFENTSAKVFSFATETIGNHSAGLTESRAGTAGLQSDLAGYLCGGGSNGTCDKLTFSTGTVAATFSTTAGSTGAFGASTHSAGILTGGTVSGVYSALTKKVSFADDTISAVSNNPLSSFTTGAIATYRGGLEAFAAIGGTGTFVAKSRIARLAATSSLTATGSTEANSVNGVVLLTGVGAVVPSAATDYIGVAALGGGSACSATALSIIGTRCGYLFGTAAASHEKLRFDTETALTLAFSLTNFGTADVSTRNTAYGLRPEGANALTFASDTLYQFSFANAPTTATSFSTPDYGYYLTLYSLSKLNAATEVYSSLSIHDITKTTTTRLQSPWVGYTEFVHEYAQGVRSVYFSTETIGTEAIGGAFIAVNQGSCSTEDNGYWYTANRASSSIWDSVLTNRLSFSSNTAVILGHKVTVEGVSVNAAASDFAGYFFPTGSVAEKLVFSTETMVPSAATLNYSTREDVFSGGGNSGLQRPRLSGAGTLAVRPDMPYTSGAGYIIGSYVWHSCNVVLAFGAETMTEVTDAMRVPSLYHAATQNSNIGYLYGESLTAANEYKIDKLYLASGTVAAGSVHVDIQREYPHMVTSSSAAYIEGSPQYAGSQDIEKYLYSTDTLSLTGTSFATQLGLGAAAQSTSAGYFAGGLLYGTFNTTSNAIRKIGFSNEALSTLSATLGIDTLEISSVQSGTKGYFFAGWRGSGLPQDNITALVFSNETASSLAASYPGWTSAKRKAGVQSSTKGYLAGGERDYVDYLTFSGETTGTLAQALTTMSLANLNASAGVTYSYTTSAILFGVASLDGAGTLAAATSVLRKGIAALAGAGGITAVPTAAITHFGVAVCAGQGAVAAVGTVSALVSGAATVSASGSLTSAASKTTTGAAALSGASAVTVAAGAVLGAASTLESNGGMAASAVLTLSATSIVVANGALTATPRAAFSAVAAMQGVGAILCRPRNILEFLQWDTASVRPVRAEVVVSDPERMTRVSPRAGEVASCVSESIVSAMIFDKSVNASTPEQFSSSRDIEQRIGVRIVPSMVKVAEADIVTELGGPNA